MKKLSVLFVLTMLFSFASSAQEQVKWTYQAKKIKDKTYEVRIIATIPKGWFIYAQQQPEESVSQPTSFSFTHNPVLIIPDQPLQEEGHVIKKSYATLGYDANIYKDSVEFVQTVTLKANVKTNLLGTVRYQVCDDHRCMPADDAKFEFKLQ